MQLDGNFAGDRYHFAEGKVRALAVSGRRHLIFDIGAGDGSLRSLAGVDFEWSGFDREEWGDVIGWDLAKPCPLVDRLADVVLLLDVIEHLPNPGLALHNISAAMQDGGVLIVTTPNPRWSGSRINTLVRGEVSSFSEHDLDENYHVLPIWPHVLDRFLGEAGLMTESYFTLGGPTRLFEAKGRLSGPLRWMLNAVQMVIESADATAQGDSYAMVAVKRSGVAKDYAYPSISSPSS
jgi:SAM-dependent methyltransferase